LLNVVIVAERFTPRFCVIFVLPSGGWPIWLGVGVARR
jgi:hypothetical protein